MCMCTIVYTCICVASTAFWRTKTLLSPTILTYRINWALPSTYTCLYASRKTQHISTTIFECFFPEMKDVNENIVAVYIAQTVKWLSWLNFRI